mmetsp:Transcript_42422/g.62965  ORF Transcript_42422/g.62965 Transcript_42422/m.62965 type:complete len:98 (-) Transcript_42422:508-801(-)
MVISVQKCMLVRSTQLVISIVMSNEVAWMDGWIDYRSSSVSNAINPEEAVDVSASPLDHSVMLRPTRPPTSFLATMNTLADGLCDDPTQSMSYSLRH